MKTLDHTISGLFLDYSCRKLETMTGTLGVCLSKLTDAQIWERHGAHENTVGNLVLHLCGNTRQWLIAGVGGATDVREREAEFNADGGMGAEELMRKFASTMSETREIIASLSAHELLKRINPQNGEVSVLDAIYQVVGHVQQHVGQIILLTKQMTSQDLNLTIPRQPQEAAK